MTSDLKDILERLFRMETLSKEEAADVLTGIGEGRVDSYQIAAFLTCFNMRALTGEELSGFRQAMMNLAVPVDLSGYDTIDVCGTGGDGKDTFNISTAAAFVIAGAGYKVAKHGNYSATSGCGSSNVLEYLGYKMSTDIHKLRMELEEANFCYMHAPLFHPAMKEVAPVRKALKVKTFFNMLGPLLNPSNPGRQLTGVYSAALIPAYRAAFEDMGTRFAIIHSNDGYDEISLTCPFRCATSESDSEVQLADIGMKAVDAGALSGGRTVAEAAGILVKILSGRGNESQNNVVCANAAFAIQLFKTDSSVKACIEEARDSLEGGAAHRALSALIDLN